MSLAIEQTALTDFGYTGQRLDASTDGLMYYGARYYLPELRRFISADTVVPGAGNPQNLNRYSYVLNNPVKYMDPTGHWIDAGDGMGYTRPLNERLESYARRHPQTNTPSGNDENRSGSDISSTTGDGIVVRANSWTPE